MAVRYIATRLAVEGEKEYKQAIANINREFKTLSTELKLVESQFKGQANTVAALSAKGDVLAKLYQTQAEKVKELESALDNAQRAQKAHADSVEAYKTKIASVESELENFANSTGDTTQEQEKLREELAKLNAGLSEAEAKEAAAARGVADWQQQLNGAKVVTNDLSQKIKENNNYLSEARLSMDGCASSIDEFGKKSKQAGDEAAEMGDKTAKAVEAMAALLAAAGVKKSIEEIVKVLWDAVEASIEFESAITGVFKTVDATAAQRAEITQSLTDMSLVIPVTTTELAALAQTAGQLGIDTENITTFTEVMAKMGVATELSGTAAAEVMAKLANIMQTSQTNFDRMGSTIVALGNNFATSEPKIAEMALRLAGAGKTANMSEAEVLGLATALSSLGIEAQAGGSSFSKVISSMQAAAELGPKNAEIIRDTGMSLRELQLFANASAMDFTDLALSMGMTSTELKNVMKQQQELEDFAKVTNMTANEFSRAFGADAAGTLSKFVLGLAELDEEGQSAIVTLDEMGITELRMRDALLRTTNANELFADALGLANTAWEENIALQNEANTFFATTESKMLLLQNSVSALKVKVGDELKPALSGLIDVGQDLIGGMSDIIDKNPWLVGAVTALTIAIGLFAVGLTAFTVVTKIATIANEAFKVSMGSTPYGAIALAIGLVTTAIIAFIEVSKNGTDEVDKLTIATTTMLEEFDRLDTAMADAGANTEAAASLAGRYIDRLKELETQGLTTAEAQREYAAIVDMLNELIPGLNATIDEQTGLVNGGTDALRDNTEAWRENAIAQALAEKRSGVTAAYADAMIEAERNQIAYNNAVAKGNMLEADAKKAQAELAAALNMTSEEYGNLTYEQRSAMLSGITSNDATLELYQNYKSLSGALAENAAEQDNLKTALDISGEAVTRYNEEIAELDDLQKNLIDDTNDLAAAQTTAAETQAAQDEAMMASVETIQGLTGEMDRLIQSYNEAYWKAHENISNTLGLFNEIKMESEKSVDDFIKALTSQENFLNEYSENIKKAMEAGVDEGIIQSLSDGSVESAEILKAIVDGGEDKIKELNEKFGLVQEGKDEFSTIVAEMETDFTERLDEMNHRLDQATEEWNKQNEAYEAGADTARAYAQALNDIYPEVKAAADRIASAVADAMNATAQLDGIKLNGSHAGGLAYVPFDGYIAELHKGERVLTAQEARDYIEMSQASFYTTTQTVNETKKTVAPHIEVHVHTQQVTDAEAYRLVQIVNDKLGEGL